MRSSRAPWRRTFRSCVHVVFCFAPLRSCCATCFASCRLSTRFKPSAMPLSSLATSSSQPKRKEVRCLYELCPPPVLPPSLSPNPQPPLEGPKLGLQFSNTLFPTFSLALCIFSDRKDVVYTIALPSSLLHPDSPPGAQLYVFSCTSQVKSGDYHMTDHLLPLGKHCTRVLYVTGCRVDGDKSRQQCWVVRASLPILVVLILTCFSMML